jgi:hypothetical protein
MIIMICGFAIPLGAILGLYKNIQESAITTVDGSKTFT